MRLGEEHTDILKKISAACGVSEATATKWAIQALGDYFTHHGGRLLLPLRFQETFSVTTLDPSKPMILHELPRAESKSDARAGAGKRNRGSRLRV